MALKEAGVPAREYENDRPAIAVKLYEGDLIYRDTSFNQEGRTIEDWDVSAPMHIGQYVELHEDSTARDIIVKPAEEGSTKIVGKLIIRPKLKNSLGWADNEINRLPRENTEWGNFTPRTGTVEFRGHAIDYLDIADDNDAIAPMDYIKYAGDDLFEKSSNKTNTIALAKVEANIGGKVPVLSNYYGI